MSRVIPVLALSAMLAGCGGSEAAQAELERLKASAPDPDAARVEIAQLKPSEASLSLELPGEVSGWNDALLASALGGLVEKVWVEEGEHVRKGAALVAVDQATYAAQLEQAEAQLEQAEADLKRLDDLGDLATDAQLTGARTQVKVAESQAKIARTQLQRAVIRAPFDGTVGALNVEVGEFAAPGTPVLRLVQLDPIKITLSVSDRDVVALEPGLDAHVSTQARSGIREGHIARVSPVADLSTRSFLVDVELPNPQHDLLPGMIAQVRVARELDRDTVVLPQDWIVTKLDSYGVFVAEDGKARWRPVALGDVVRGEVVVTDGLAVGDRVVMVGQHRLVDGDDLLIAREGWCCESGRAVFTTSTAKAP